MSSAQVCCTQSSSFLCFVFIGEGKKAGSHPCNLQAYSYLVYEALELALLGWFPSVGWIQVGVG